MVLFEASVAGLVLVGAADVYAYQKYRESVARLEEQQTSSSSNNTLDSEAVKDRVVSESIQRVVDAVRAGDEGLLAPRDLTGFSTASRREIESLAKHSQVTDLIAQDAARVGEVPILGEGMDDASEECVVEVGLPVEESESEEGEDEEAGSGFDAEKAAVDLSNSIEDLRKQLRGSKDEINSLKKELAALKKKKR